jgi:hypothetical protein
MARVHGWLRGVLAGGRDRAAAACLAVLPFVAFYRLWLSGPHAEYLSGDTNNTYWSDLAFVHRALAHGQLPLWNPFERGGLAVLSDPEAGVLYPVNWLFAAAGVVLGGMPYVMIEIKACLHLAIGGVLFFVWLRRRQLPLGAAIAGSVLYELGPYSVGNANYSLIWPLAWMPAVLLSTDWLLGRGGERAALAVAACTALVVVAGSPPTAFYASLVAVPYFCLRAAARARIEGLRPFLERRGGALVLAAILAAVACAPSLLATLEATRYSARAVRSFAYVAQNPLPASQWLAFVLPARASAGAFVGLPAVLLAVVGIALGRPRGEIAMFALLASAGLLLMMGSGTPLLRLLYTLLPPFRLFRICARYVFLVHVAVAVLAAHGIGALIARMHPWVGGRLSIALALVVAYDLVSTVPRAGVTRPGRFDPSTQAWVSDAWVARMQEATDDYRVFAEFGLAWRPGSRLGLRDLRGYPGPLVMQRVLDVYDRLGDAPWILSLFNVRWLLHSEHPYIRHGLRANFVKFVDDVPGLQARDGAVYEFDAPAPYAYWVGGARVERTAAGAVGVLGDLDPHGELVLAEEDVGPVGADRRMTHAPRVAAVLEARTLSFLRFAVDAPAPGYLVVNESWFPGWQATIDDRAATVLRGNVIMQAIELPPGKHVVELRFRPAYVLGPLALAACTWLGAIAAVARRRRRSTRGAPTGSR